jgi:hypothetical protein
MSTLLDLSGAYTVFSSKGVTSSAGVYINEFITFPGITFIFFSGFGGGGAIMT